MTLRDVPSYEMSDFQDISDADLDAVLADRVAIDDERLGSVARFIADFQMAHPERPTDGCEATHLAAMMEAAQLTAANGDPAAKPASKADGPAVQASGLPKPRRSMMFDRLLGAPLWAKISAATVAVFVAFSGVAFAGVLPHPVQKAVSDTAAVVGIALPDGVDEEVPTAADQQEPDETVVDDQQGADEDAAGEKGATEAEDADADESADAADADESAIEADDETTVDEDDSDDAPSTSAAPKADAQPATRAGVSEPNEEPDASESDPGDSEAPSPTED